MDPEINDVATKEAQASFYAKYVEAPGFDKITNRVLQHQLVDFGVNSGPFLAIQRLQEALGTEIDGKLGPKTLDILSNADPRTINNLIVAERVKLLCKICVKTPSQLKFLAGWVTRALEFLV